MVIKEKINEGIIRSVATNRLLRNLTFNILDEALRRNIMENAGIPAFSLEKKLRYSYLSAILHQVGHNLDMRYIKPEVTRKMISVFTTGGNLKTDRKKRLNPNQEKYLEKYGEYPPLFCVLSPTMACNLNCTGCYATSCQDSVPKLDFEIARWVVEEIHDEFGSKFMTISGGEPFLYKSKGKTIWDIWEEFRDMFFLVYTNATMIDQETAERLASLGNVTPCISIEGYEEHTDERRGKGVHQKVMDAIHHLRKSGVPYGISVTATKKNIGVLLTEEFYDFCFKELAATYVFQFQMMPVGRGKEVIDMMITPKQRVGLYHLWKKLLMEKKYPMADFWNSGALTDGCLAYGRWGGYFYVNWHGNVMPCVFVPFYVDNVNDLYNSKRHLGEALQSEFFRNGRKWQVEYGMGNPGKKKNILMPCSIKDHHDNFRENILTTDAKSENSNAEHMRDDEEFVEILRRYDQELENLTKVIFEKEYLQKDLTLHRMG